MDVLVLITIIVGCVALLILIVGELPVGIGRSGEIFVSGILHNLDPLRYKILNDLMLPSRGNTATTQIDHIVVSNHGIFCIETKAYKGWIFGSANQEQWKQVIFRYKGNIYNPLRQNYAHTKAIEDILGARRLKKPIVSLVAFTDADMLKISGTDCVGYARDIVRKIESYITPVYSNVERDEIYNMLITANIVDKETRKLHNRDVREIKRY